VKLNERAVSPVIGFILIVQILIIFLAVIQTTVIPDQLKKVEASNVERFKGEFEKFSALVTSGDKAYMLVTTPEYPDYLFLLTPEPAGFSIYSEPFEISLNYTEILPNGTKISVSKTFESRRIYVRIDNYFYPDTTFIFENTAVFQKSGDRIAVIGDQRLINRGIDLVLIYGNLSGAYNSPKEFTLNPVSTGGYVYFENATLTFDTVYPDYWKKFGEVSGSRVTLKVPSGFLKINVYAPSGESVSREPLRMVKLNAFDSYNLSVGETKDFGILLLDRFNNPVTGGDVTVSVEGGIGEVYPAKTKTDSTGRAFVTFRATSPGSGKIVFSSGNLKVEYSVTVLSPPTYGGGRGLLRVVWLDKQSVDSYYGNVWDAGLEGRKTLRVGVYDSSNSPLPNIDVSFVVTNESVVEINRTLAKTDSNGIATIEASPTANGTTKIFAFAGDSGDVLNLTITNVTRPSWVFSGWKYRVPIYIKELSGNTLNDYQVLVTLNSTFNWSAVRSDLSDVRFTDSQGNELSYWIEDYSYGSFAKIWVKVPVIPANSNTVIYMYYGNSSATSKSNGELTFIYFDDFTSDTSSRYTVWENWIGSPTFIWNPGGSEVRSDTSNADYFLTTKVNVKNDFAVEIRGYTQDNDALGSLIRTTDGRYYIASMRVSDYDGTPQGGSSEALIMYQSPPSWYREAILLTSFGDIVNPTSWQISGIAYYGESLIALYNHKKAGSYYVGTISIDSIGLSSQANSPPAHYDWIIVRKYVDPEPQVTIGEEEVLK